MYEENKKPIIGSLITKGHSERIKPKGIGSVQKPVKKTKICSGNTLLLLLLFVSTFLIRLISGHAFALFPLVSDGKGLRYFILNVHATPCS